MHKHLRAFESFLIQLRHEETFALLLGVEEIILAHPHVWIQVFLSRESFELASLRIIILQEKEFFLLQVNKIRD